MNFFSRHPLYEAVGVSPYKNPGDRVGYNSAVLMLQTFIFENYCMLMCCLVIYWMYRILLYLFHAFILALNITCDYWINLNNLQLCRKISGLNATKAKHIVEWRNQHGSFINRKQLLEIKGLGPKSFEQCAGFVKILPETTTGTIK